MKNNTGKGAPEVDFQVRFVHHEEIAKMSDGAAFTKQAMQAARDLLSEDQINALLAMEFKLLDWIRQSPQNAALFFADPIRALPLSGLDLDPNLLKILSQMPAAKPSFEAMSGFEVKSVKIE